MAVYDMQEQEQIDTLKSWWKQYGKLVILLIVAAALTVGAIVGWQGYREKQAAAAGELYDQLLTAADSGDRVKVREIASVLIEQYPRTGHTALAALVAARIAVDEGDLAGAQARLQWLVEKARDDETRDLARLRLAAVQLDQKKYPEALTLLETAHAPAWDALYADLKGDVLVAQDRQLEARAAYQIALDKSAEQSPYRALVQSKLDALGGAK
jgi:predicted negative regulator of RcsB-dependent stress response